MAGVVHYLATILIAVAAFKGCRSQCAINSPSPTPLHLPASSNISSFNSTGYPTAAYPNNQRCVWIIEAPVGHTITLHLVELHTDTHPSCMYDSVSIYDGATTSSPQIAKRCGLNVSAEDFYSSGPSLYVDFTSDISENHEGFSFEYSAVEQSTSTSTGHPGYSTTTSGSYSQQNSTLTTQLIGTTSQQNSTLTTQLIGTTSQQNSTLTTQQNSTTSQQNSTLTTQQTGTARSLSNIVISRQSSVTFNQTTRTPTQIKITNQAVPATTNGQLAATTSQFPHKGSLTTPILLHTSKSTRRRRQKTQRNKTPVESQSKSDSNPSILIAVIAGMVVGTVLFVVGALFGNCCIRKIRWLKTQKKTAPQSNLQSSVPSSGPHSPTSPQSAPASTAESSGIAKSSAIAKSSVTDKSAPVSIAEPPASKTVPSSPL